MIPDARGMDALKDRQEFSLPLPPDPKSSMRLKQPSPETLFQQAVVLQGQNKPDQALRLYARLLAVQPRAPEAYFNMAVIHHQCGRWQQALDCYAAALRLKPEWPAAWYNLAQAREAAGDIDDSIAAYRRAIDIQPEYQQAHYNMGLIHLVRQEYAPAEERFKAAIALQPEHAPSHNNLGKALQAQGHIAEAQNAFSHACHLDPSLAQAWFNLAEIAQAEGELETALTCYQRALQLRPDMEEACNNLGNAYRKLGQYDQAVSCYRTILAHHPQKAEVHYNLGSTLRLQEDLEPALSHLLRAVQLKPDYADAWNNLALTCKNIGDLDRALTCFNQALAIHPDMAVARWNRAFVYLLQENFAAGWADFEWRFRMPQRKSIYPFQLEGPRWQGQPVPSATILVHDEQGLGDTLQFVRYLPLVKARCRHVVLETRAELISLLHSAAGVDQIVPRSGDGRPAALYDYHIPLMSLPGLFHTKAATIPARTPYLYANPQKTAHWLRQLPVARPKIGLVWSGRPQHTNDHNRSCRLIDLFPLLSLEGIQFIGLQKGPGAVQIRELPEKFAFLNLGDALRDFEDTAAVLAHLDMLITVDTAAAHLAGAMGKPVWVLIPFIPDWRWSMQRCDSPWYPSMRLFRQSAPRDWLSPINAMQSQLQALFHRKTDTSTPTRCTPPQPQTRC